jgi:hypothetical protein
MGAGLFTEAVRRRKAEKKSEPEPPEEIHSTQSSNLQFEIKARSGARVKKGTGKQCVARPAFFHVNLERSNG